MEQLIPPRTLQHSFILAPATVEAKLTITNMPAAQQAQAQAQAPQPPKLSADILLDVLSLHLTKRQYDQILGVLYSTHTFHTVATQHLSLRPRVPPRGNDGARAWFRYAVQCTLADIHERRRKCTWPYMRQRKQQREQYIMCYKNHLRGQEAKGDRDALRDLERVLSFDDIVFYRSLATVRLRQERARDAGCVTVKVKPSGPASLFKKLSSSPVFAAAAGTSTARAVAAAAVAATQQQQKQQRRLSAGGELSAEYRAELLQLLQSSKDASSGTGAVKVQFTLLRGSFVLADERGDFLSLSFAGAAVHFADSGSAAESGVLWDLVVAVNTLGVEDLTAPPAGLMRHILRLDAQPQKQAFELQLTKPANAKGADCDLRLGVRLESSEVLLSQALFAGTSRFFRPPTSVHASALFGDISRWASHLTGAQLKVAIERRTTVDVHVNFRAPTVVFPMGTHDGCTLLVLDLGNLSARSDLGNCGEDCDTYVVQLKHMQAVIVTDSSAPWRSQLTSSSSPPAYLQNLVRPFDLTVTFCKAFPGRAAPDAPLISLAVALTTMELDLSDVKWRTLCGIYRHLMPPPPPDESPLAAAAEDAAGPLQLLDADAAPTGMLFRLDVEAQRLSVNLVRHEDGRRIASLSAESLRLRLNEADLRHYFTVDATAVRGVDWWETSSDPALQALLTAEEAPALHVDVVVPPSSATIVTCAIAPFSVQVNLPTVIALMAFFDVDRTGPAPAPDPLPPQPFESPTNAVVTLNLARATVYVSRDSAQLARLTVERAAARLTVKRRTLHVQGELGGLGLRDLRRSAGRHSDAVACGVAPTQAGVPWAVPVVTFELQTFSVAEPNFPGVDSRLRLEIDGLRLVFLAEFIFGLADHIALFAAVRPLVAATRLDSRLKAVTRTLKRNSIDVKVTNSDVGVPQSPTAPEYLAAQVPRIRVTNEFTADAEVITVALGPGASLSCAGTAECEGVLLPSAEAVITVTIPFAFTVSGTGPEVEVLVESSPLVGRVTQEQFNMLLRLAFENFDAYTEPRPDVLPGAPVPDRWRVIEVHVPSARGAAAKVWAPDDPPRMLAAGDAASGEGCGLCIRVEMHGYTRQVSARLASIAATDLLQPYGEQLALLFRSEGGDFLDFSYSRIQRQDRSLEHSLTINIGELHANLNHQTALALITFFNPLPETWAVIPDTQPMATFQVDARLQRTLAITLNTHGTKFAELAFESANVTVMHDETKSLTDVKGNLRQFSVLAVETGQQVFGFYDAAPSSPSPLPLQPLDFAFSMSRDSASLTLRLGAFSAVYVPALVERTQTYTTELRILTSLLRHTTARAVNASAQLPPRIALDVVAHGPRIRFPDPSHPEEFAINSALGTLRVATDGDSFRITLTDVCVLSNGATCGSHTILENVRLTVDVSREPCLTVVAALPALSLELTHEEYALVAELALAAAMLGGTSSDEAALIPHQLRAPPKDVRLPHFAAKFELGGVEVRLLGVARFAVSGVAARATFMQSGRLEASLVVHSAEVTDTREQRSVLFHRLLLAPAEAVEPAGQKQPALRLEYEFGDGCHTVDLAVERPQACCIPFSLRAIIEFLSLPKHRQQPQNPRVAAAPAPVVLPPLPRLSMRAAVRSPEVLLFEEVHRADTRVLVLHLDASAVVDTSAPPRAVFTAEVRDLEVFSCRNDQPQTTKVAIVKPWTIFAEARLDADNCTLNVHTGSCDITAAYNDAKLLLITASQVAPSYSPTTGSSDTADYAFRTHRIPPDPVLSMIALLSSSITTYPTQSSSPSQSPPLSKSQSLAPAPEQERESFPEFARRFLAGRDVRAQFTLPSLYLVVVNDFYGVNTPVLDLLITELHASSSAGLTASVAQCLVKSSYFNDAVSCWEPLLDPCSLRVEVDWRGKNPKIAMNLPELVAVTVTPNFLTSVVSISKAWAQDYSSYHTNADGVASRETFCPYRVVNSSGTPLACRTCHRGAKSAPLLLQPGDAVSLDPGRSYSYLAAGVLSVRIYNPGGTGHAGKSAPCTPWIPVSCVGAFIFDAIAGSQLAVEVALDRGGCKVITLRSCTSVRNNTSMPVDVAVFHGAAEVGRLDAVAPGAEAHLPVALSTKECAFAMRPHSGFYWSQHFQPAAECAAEELVSCIPHSHEDACYFVLSAARVPVTPCAERDIGVPGSLLRLNVSPPLQLFNGLLCGVAYHVCTSGGECTGVLAPAETIDVHGADVRETLQLQLRFLTPDGAPWSQPTTVWAPAAGRRSDNTRVKTETTVTLRTTAQAQHPTQAQSTTRSLTVTCAGRAGRHLRLGFFSRFWAVNKTPYAVQFDATVGVLVAPGAPLEPLGVAPGSDGGGGDGSGVSGAAAAVVRTRVRLQGGAESPWSQFFRLDTVGANVLLLTTKNKQQQQTAAACPQILLITTLLSAPFEGVHLLTFTPHFMLLNATPLLLHLRAAPAQPDDVIALDDDFEDGGDLLLAATSAVAAGDTQLDTGQWLPLYCNKTLWIRLEGYNWAEISVDALETFVMRMHNEDSRGIFFVEVEVKLVDSVVHVILSRAQHPPFVAENHTRHAIELCQTGASCLYNLPLPPLHAAPLAWDSPNGQRFFELCHQRIDVEALDKLQKIDVPPNGTFPRPRTLAVKVLAGGSSRVVKVMEYSDACQLSSDALGDEPVCLITLVVAGASISILDATPQELLHVSIDGVFSEVMFLSSRRECYLKVYDLQIDNQVPHPMYPVLLYRTPGKTAEDAALPLLQVHFSRAAASPPLESSATTAGPATTALLPDLEILIGTVDVLLEEVTLVQIFSIVDGVTKDVRRVLLRDEDEASAALHVLRVAVQSPEEIAASKKSTATASGGVDRIYVEKLRVSPLKLNVTLSPTVGFKYAQRTFNILSRVLGTFAYIEDAPVRFTDLEANDVYTTVPSFFERVGGHYKAQWMNQVFSLIGSSDTLGSPVVFFRGIKAGVSELASARGLKFVQHTTYAVSNSVSGVTKSVGSGLLTLTGDTDYMARRQRRALPANLGQGVLQGLQDFGQGVFGGITGVVSQPIYGAMDSGTGGFLWGLAGGVVGVAAKPLAGVFDLASSTSKGLRNQTHVGRVNVKRRRHARVIGPGNVVPPFSEAKALGQYMLHEANDGAYRDKRYLDHITFYLDGKSGPACVAVVLAQDALYHVEQVGARDPSIVAHVARAEAAPLLARASANAGARQLSARLGLGAVLAAADYPPLCHFLERNGLVKAVKSPKL
eukprot:TRINITY_DN207_c0_g1_i1.p1 TRINITY_DN207_c0_g1~~TRINITY_DN207_c0_g1_i1.p1  ORF type:complete len:3214 (-),score=639.93 TRINITY_DN207_c0_g1_i1:77-9718(-)